MRVLGIDTSLRSTGFAVVESVGNRMASVEYGTIRVPARILLSGCLQRLHDGLREVIAKTQPEEAAVEGVFFAKNAKTALILGQARGAAIAACATQGLAIYEYAPRRVKQAVVGFGGADKTQVRQMVMSLLGLNEEPQEDAADALAIAICHLHGATQHELLKAKAI